MHEMKEVLKELTFIPSLYSSALRRVIDRQNHNFRASIHAHNRVNFLTDANGIEAQRCKTEGFYTHAHNKVNFLTDENVVEAQKCETIGLFYYGKICW